MCLAGWAAAASAVLLFPSTSRFVLACLCTLWRRDGAAAWSIVLSVCCCFVVVAASWYSRPPVAGSLLPGTVSSSVGDSSSKARERGQVSLARRLVAPQRGLLLAAAVAGAGAGAGLELELAAAGSVGSMQRQQQQRSVVVARGGMPVLRGNPVVSCYSGSSCRAFVLSAVTVYTCAGFPAPFAFGAAEPACCVILRVPQGALGGGREWFCGGHERELLCLAGQRILPFMFALHGSISLHAWVVSRACAITGRATVALCLVHVLVC